MKMDNSQLDDLIPDAEVDLYIEKISLFFILIFDFIDLGYGVVGQFLGV